jgi:hypothetical protein
MKFSDGPRFKDRPKSVQAESGTQVTLNCDVDSNPPASIKWLQGEAKKVSQNILIAQIFSIEYFLLKKLIV